MSDSMEYYRRRVMGKNGRDSLLGAGARSLVPPSVRTTEISDASLPPQQLQLLLLFHHCVRGPAPRHFRGMAYVYQLRSRITYVYIRTDTRLPTWTSFSIALARANQ